MNELHHQLQLHLGRLVREGRRECNFIIIHPTNFQGFVDNYGEHPYYRRVGNKLYYLNMLFITSKDVSKDEFLI